jgi:hypothetical protein
MSAPTNSTSTKFGPIYIVLSDLSLEHLPFCDQNANKDEKVMSWMRNKIVNWNPESTNEVKQIDDVSITLARRDVTPNMETYKFLQFCSSNLQFQLNCCIRLSKNVRPETVDKFLILNDSLDFVHDKNPDSSKGEWSRMIVERLFISKWKHLVELSTDVHSRNFESYWETLFNMNKYMYDHSLSLVYIVEFDKLVDKTVIFLDRTVIFRSL